MTEPDWMRFYAICDELSRLSGSGQLTEDPFQRLWREAESARGSEEAAAELLEAVARYAKDRDGFP